MSPSAIADLEAVAARAGGVIAELESGGDGKGRAGLRHELRNRLGTLRAALDVLLVAPVGSELAADALDIARRHAALLDEAMNELHGGIAWEPR